MSSAERAANVVDVILDHPAKTARLMRRYQKDLDRAIGRISWFVVRFNSPILKYLFMGPRETLGITKGVLSILAGDVYRRKSLGWRLAIFKMIFAVSRMKNRELEKATAERLRNLPTISMPENEST